MSLAIRTARPGDEGLVLAFIRKLADYERLAQEMVADEERIANSLFAATPKVFCDIAEWDGEPAGLRCGSTTIRPFMPATASISRICSSSLTIAGRDRQGIDQEISRGAASMRD